MFAYSPLVLIGTGGEDSPGVYHRLQCCYLAAAMQVDWSAGLFGLEQLFCPPAVDQARRDHWIAGRRAGLHVA